MRFGVFRSWAVLAGLTALAAAGVAGQDPLRPVVDPPPPPGSGSYRVVAGPEYRSGWVYRVLIGDGYRDLWTAPVVAPVLDLESYRGGLAPIRVGGGFQTQTIHLRGGDDGYYLFRSVNKAVRKGLDPDLQDAPAGRLVQEQTSTLHPAGAWVVPPLLDAVGIPHSPPELYIMPDDPRLGEHREAFAGVLGMLVESPDKGESGEKSYRGSDDIVGSEDLLELLAASPEHRVETRSLLVSRLIDLIVGDSDRNFDNYRWIGFERPEGTLWRAVPMDRDPAFMKADGLLPWVARKTFLPKLVSYGPQYEDAGGLWASQAELDRLLLADLDRPTWDSAVAAVQSALTDAVIDEAALSMPAGYRSLGAAPLAQAMRSRRDRLPEAADRFYRDLASEVDVQATAAADVAEVEFASDGSVRVAMSGACGRRPLTQQNGGGAALACTYYERRFVPEETREVRIYLRGGDDGAVVRGDGPQRIAVRVIGGPGDDRLEDLSRPAGRASRVVFYAAEGDDTLLPAPETRVETDAFEARPITDFIFEDKSGTYRDWGERSGWLVLPDYERSANLIVGVRRRTTEYGFRREPWAEQRDLSGFVSLGGGFGAEATLRRRLEGSDVVFGVEAAAARGLGSYRFFGFGNDAPQVPSARALVPLDEVRLGLDVETPLGAGGRISAGPVFRWVWAKPDPAGPLAATEAPGSDGFGQAGVAGELRLGSVDDESFPRHGLELRGGAAVWAPLQGGTDSFGRSEGELRGYLPLPAGSALAARLGGAHAWGPFPVHEAVFLGGRRSLRGHSGERFAGDRSLYGSAELRTPLGRLTLLTRGTLGALAFADAGRVWVDGDSPGGWHGAWGGGLWYRTLGLSGAVVYGVGEERRLHAYFGLPF